MAPNKNRFYASDCSIGGSWVIYDRDNPDYCISIDCGAYPSSDLIAIMVDALNGSEIKPVKWNYGAVKKKDI